MYPCFSESGAARLDAFHGIRNCAIERGPPCAQPKRRHHQAGVAEYRLRLDQSLAFDAADQPVGIDVDVVEERAPRCC